MQKPIPIFLGEIVDGKVKINDIPRFGRYTQSLKGIVQIIVKQVRRTRTLPQNAWYWSCVVGIPADHFGYSPSEMHDAFKMKFLKIELQGKPSTVRSTSNMSKAEFSEYIERIRAWLATEYEITIPDPSMVEI